MHVTCCPACLPACLPAHVLSVYVQPHIKSLFFIHLRKRKGKEEKPCTITAKADKRFVAVVITIPRREQDPIELRTSRHVHILISCSTHSWKKKTEPNKPKLSSGASPPFSHKKKREGWMHLQSGAERVQSAPLSHPILNSTHNIYADKKEERGKKEKRGIIAHPRD